MVNAAKLWKNVPERKMCTAAEFDNMGSMKNAFFSSDKKAFTFSFDTDACEGQPGQIKFLEHAQLVLSIKSSRRGDLQINITSPMDTSSIILNRRPNWLVFGKFLFTMNYQQLFPKPNPHDDDYVDGFIAWPFTTTQLWGENPKGKWTVSMNLNPDSNTDHIAVLLNLKLIIYGTNEPPYVKEVLPSNVSDELAVVRRNENFNEGNEKNNTGKV